MVYCDITEAVIEWGSEEVIIPYLSPVDNRIHRYFPDFYMKVKQKNGMVKLRPMLLIKPNGNLLGSFVRIEIWNSKYLQKNI
jgi:hypothetical protein